MFTQIGIFILALALLLTASRLLLTAWLWPRVRAAGAPWPIFRWGLRIDLNQIAMWVGIPALLAPWVADQPLAIWLTGLWLQGVWLLFVLLEISTPQFIQEYDSRPNRLYLDYLKYPKEVFGMLWKGYKLVLAAALIALALAAWLGHALFAQAQPHPLPAWPWRLSMTLLIAAAIVLAIRGTLGHRPINPASVAWCGDSLLNTLPLNSLYNVLFALYAIKNERSAADVYGDLPDQELQAIICEQAGIPPGPPELPTLHHQPASMRPARPRNLVLIVQESLGAQYVGNLGGAGLTPCLDALAATGWNFTRAYATGTRSVRGLEAVTAGFPPTLSDAALRLTDAQSHFFTLAQLLRRHGYRSRFIYGGEAHFDNMKSFFLGNGFDELHDLPTFESPAFVGTWGASDEDMFDKLHTLLSRDVGQPTLHLAFSVTNHTPWEYPAGRIPVQGDPATVQNTVRYADWAIGQFFERARASDYWQDTVFLIVADHDARVGGAQRIPLRHFHIPALVVGAGIDPRRDERIISQIDLPATLLSLIGISDEHPMIGHDLTRPGTGGRAMMQYEDHYGYLRGDMLAVLEPQQAPHFFRYAAPDGYTPQDPDPELGRIALAHALWPTWAYRHQAHTLPELRRARPE
ncbi:LTA synthase family protein [uncultured Castellaniella sp.]|uniref:LTA synthase family protein n=1 Tax=uncultured Castellaniella sp. TaxID=647907 RepID=UPI00262958DE|nr:LTA synthase family protein [uncultured Castellaniella sp.]